MSSGIVLGVALLALGVVSSAAARENPWERFIGVYEGAAVAETDGDSTPRDLEVAVTSDGDDGFTVRWVSDSRRADGTRNRKEYTVDFEVTRRDGVFVSAMRKDLFGNRVPLNPMRGDPYVWARIVGDTLSVFALHVTDAGGYEMQVYHRTLVEDGLSLSYSRLREGEVMRTVQGKLKRVK